MRLVCSAALLTLPLALSLPAAAATIADLTLSDSIYTISLSFDPNAYDRSILGAGYDDAEYYNLSGTVNGQPSTFHLSFLFGEGDETVQIEGSDFAPSYEEVTSVTAPLSSTIYNASTYPAVVPGSYFSTRQCVEYSDPPPALPYYPCGNSVTITIGLADTTAVTPEPSTLALLGTGLVGALGRLRQRSRRHKLERR